MKHELWYSERERCGALLREGEAMAARHKWPDARVVWCAQTGDYAVAAALCADVLRWRRGESDVAGDTIRITMALCLDPRGDRGYIPVAGWVGRHVTPLPGTDEVYVGLLDYLQEVAPDYGRILGYGYIERPGQVRFDGAALVIEAKRPDTLTVASLRSRNDEEEMSQEFDGPVANFEELERKVSHRLGPELANWVIVGAQSINGFSSAP